MEDGRMPSQVKSGCESLGELAPQDPDVVDNLAKDGHGGWLRHVSHLPVGVMRSAFDFGRYCGEYATSRRSFPSAA